MKCWICEDEDAATREHMAKASDLKALFGKPSQGKPMFFSGPRRAGQRPLRNVRVGSVKADILKFAHRICLTCNSSRSQPYDYAWEHASGELRGAVPRLCAKGSFRANWLFPYDTRRCMRNVHLYFTKLLGCLAVEGNMPLDVPSLAQALLRAEPHPCVYLDFGHLAMPVELAGGSDVHACLLDGSVAFASWLYHVGDVTVNVMYAAEGEQRDGLKAAWHPRMGARRILFREFPGAQ